MILLATGIKADDRGWMSRLIFDTLGSQESEVSDLFCRDAQRVLAAFGEPGIDWWHTFRKAAARGEISAVPKTASTARAAERPACTKHNASIAKCMTPMAFNRVIVVHFGAALHP